MPERRLPEHVLARVIHRRRFLRDTALLTGAAAGLAVPAGADAASGAASRYPAWLRMFAQAAQEDIDSYTPTALTDAEFTTLKAAIARLIPADELGPGAVEAGVQIFIDRALAGPYAATLPLYQAGLAALDQAAGADGFSGLSPERQDELLTQAENSEIEGVPQGFFATLLEHTRQGMFGDPIYGGNRDFAGWDLIGFPGIKLVWTEADQQIDATVTPEHVSVERYGGTGW